MNKTFSTRQHGGNIAHTFMLWLTTRGTYFRQHVLPFPERVFVWIGSLTGLLILIVTPPFYAFDEGRHFHRAYQISEGTFLSSRNAQGDASGGMLPVSVKEFVQQLSLETTNDRQSIAEVLATRNQELTPDERTFVAFSGATLYSPVSYSTQAVAIAVGRLFDLAPFWLFYLARLTNLATSIAVIFCAIKIIPFFKWVTVFIALTPTTVFQMATLSADSMTNSFALLMVALILHYAFCNTVQSLHWSDVLLLGLVGTVLGLTKQIYFLLLLTYFLIPVSKLGGTLRYSFSFISISVMLFVPLILWSLIVQHSVMVPLYGPEYNVSPERQVQFILSDPPGYTAILLANLIGYRLEHLPALMGQLGYWLRLNPTLIGMHMLILIGLSLVDGHRHIQFKFFHKELFLMIIIASIILIYTAGYIGWNPVGSKSIQGIQFRYFIPFLPLFCLLFYNQRFCLDIRRYYLHVGIAVYLLMILCWSTWLVLTTYFQVYIG